VGPYQQRILIAGGGPVGLVAAYALGQAGIPVTVFDENPELQDDPRAATTHPATLELLDQLGVIGEVESQGLICPIFRFWDRPTGDLVAEFDHGLLKNDTSYPYAVQCEQFKLSRILVSRLATLDHCEVRFANKVTGISHDINGVKAEVETPNGRETSTGRWLIGADGGRSLVRKQAGIAFEGFTWAERFLVLSTPFDFEAERGMCYRNYIADPREWCNCFKVAADGSPGLWRLVYPVDPEAEEATLLADEFTQNRMQRFFPIKTDYDLVHRNLYTVHQRVAETFRKGRVLLAGDAAHVNNSIGGMGLNGGIQDAMNLAEKLAAVWRSEADDSLMDRYDAERRTFANDFVQQQTIQNKKRLEARDPEKRKANLDNLRATSRDPEKARQFMLQTSMITAMRRLGQPPKPAQSA
jgi:3-(3-hydroxy-phenyl)propionate hydroxylase